MTLTRDNIAALNATLALMATDTTQSKIARKVKLSVTAMSAFISGLRKHGVKIPQKTSGRPKVSIAKPKASAKAVIAAKATRKYTNGAHAR
jgi:biotin operon repressor